MCKSCEAIQVLIPPLIPSPHPEMRANLHTFYYRQLAAETAILCEDPTVRHRLIKEGDTGMNQTSAFPIGLCNIITSSMRMHLRDALKPSCKRYRSLLLCH
jgi:hypothetical protein